MNIFTISPSPALCAAALDDKRVTKMALETAQILCSALYIHGYEDIPYPPLYLNHPCIKWAALNLGNWEWLLSYLEALNHEYRLRFKKQGNIATYSIIIDNDFPAIAKTLLPLGEVTAFENCSGFPELEIYEAYKQCLNQKWSNTKHALPRWSNTQPPEWKL